ncbi:MULTISPECIES: AraC family transcriptional regulator [unclassified Paenibacillus]|uniref:AraC family transcriptional regulator n=1 Tax=unclassified Paenibacillus TaxID=185978 RepID=UPI000953B783|nr:MULTISPECIES: AraC family transcriptional regulator [unclassified Paenibacillus]ASS68586.1 AraC family transcriptional regulator [Paenibacillus sp. RUD330]SIR64068.1 AraC-like ligand binding domain-containing protein [Paenibacillus sp. RU4X]SIR72201.1 AraC-like ligand binding domain-containing protein [Paenibacillus sp. RU4T]
MERPLSLLEEMSMPDPNFPVKLCTSRFAGRGRILFEAHWHNHMELLYIREGHAVVECNYASYEAGPGDLIAVNSNDIHMGILLSDEIEYDCLIADLGLLQSLSPDAAETKYITPIVQNRILFRNVIRGDGQLNDCMEQLQGEFAWRQPGFELSVKSLLYRLLTLLLRGYVEVRLTEPESRARLRNLERFRPIFHHIETHYTEELTVDSLAGLASLSRFHFSRLFRQLTGRTVTDYVNRIRINKSEDLLRNTEKTIAEIAMAAGYNDLSYFSRTFRRYRGLAPSEVRVQR